jgi:hypothetical protein
MPVRKSPTNAASFLWFGFQVPDELFSQPEVQRLVVTNTVTEEYANIRLPVILHLVQRCAGQVVFVLPVLRGGWFL